MKRIVFSVVIFAIALISVAYGRTWTDNKGRHITADYVSLLQLDEPKVKVLEPDGEYILVPVKALSKEDQDYILQIDNKGGSVGGTEGGTFGGGTEVKPPVDTEKPPVPAKKSVPESVIYSSLKNLDIGSREAYESLLQIRDNDPTRIEPDYTMGLLFVFKKRDYLAAQKHFARCLKINPDNTGALLNMGTLCILKGNYPEAFTHYQNVYSLGGANLELSHNIRKLLEESSSHNIFMSSGVRNKFVELSGKVSQKVNTKFNPKQGWMFEKCSEGFSQESYKCHWFQLKGYRPYEFPVCPKCNGTGKADCPNKNCAGGKVPYTVKVTRTFPDGRQVKMPTRKFKTCEVCRGKSHVSCPLCKGSGLEFKLSRGEIEESERRIQREIEERKSKEQLEKMHRQAQERRAQREIDEREIQAQRAIEEKEYQAKREQEEKERQAQKEREEQIKKEREERRLQAIKARTIVVGDCEISITDISNGYVPLRNEYSSGSGVSYGTQNVQQRIMSGISYSSKPQLMLKVRIKNNNPKKIIHFNTWAGDSQGPKASLTDNDNTYKRYVPDYGKTIYGNSTQESIYPGKYWTETLAFEPPVPGSNKLTLVLPGENIGEEGSFKIEFNYRF